MFQLSHFAPGSTKVIGGSPLPCLNWSAISADGISWTGTRRRGESIGAHRSWDGSVAVPDGEDSIVPGDEIMPDVLPSASADVPGMPESLIFQSKMP